MMKHPIRLVLCIGIIAIVLAGLYRFGPFKHTNSVRISSTSTLLEAIDITELSAAEFRYRGIAEVYNDKGTKVKCRICYNGVVKAGIDMKNVKFDTDVVSKTITATLPKIDLKVNIIDEQSMTVLPLDAKIEINDMIKYCKEDLEKEAVESKDLKRTARENLSAAIEGLLLPILKQQGYSLVFK